MITMMENVFLYTDPWHPDFLIPAEYEACNILKLITD